MCLITKQTEPFIAQEDIVVYKKLRNWKGFDNYHSIFHNFEYVLGKLYNTEVRRNETDYTVYDVQVSKYYGILTTNIAQDAKPEGLVSYGAGFHFATSVGRIYNENEYSDVLIMKCTVPKGSEYYLDETGLGVANNIIINEVATS